MARKKKQKSEAAVAFAEPDLETSTRPRLTAEEVQKKEFRLGFRGYHEGEVDEFLDRVTEDIAALHEENKRLREQLRERSGQGPLDLQAADHRAEQIVREAREHAARLVAEAEKRAGEVGGAGVSGAAAAPSWYLFQERDFLERLASLVKEHADELKQHARARVQEEAGPVDTPATAVPVAHPASEEGPTGEENVVVDLGEGSEEPDEAEPDEEEANPGRAHARSDLPRLGATAPMDPVATPGGEPDLLSDWETSIGSSDDARPRRRHEDDPSLKELFWGEDS